MLKRRATQILFSAALASTSAAYGQIRIVTMNGANGDSGIANARTPWMTDILQAIGTSVSNDPTTTDTGLNTGFAKPIDILCLQEVYTQGTTAFSYKQVLQGLYPTAHYTFASLNGGSVPNDSTQGVVYNSDVVTLMGQSAFGTVGSGTTNVLQPRQTLRYQFRPVGYDSTADFYIYNSHYKAGSATNDKNKRQSEATNVRSNADALGAGTNIIHLGDFNCASSTEGFYQTLMAAGNGKLNDPINKPGTWLNSSTFLNIHSQSPWSSAARDSLGTGFTGTSGGMDDRFDFQLVSDNTNDGTGFAYIPNTYQVFGNNGTHTINQPINVAGNTAQPSNILTDLAGVLDHLPVVADYQFPAKLNVSVPATPAQVLIGASVSVNVSVNNSAPATSSNAADVLAYTLTSSGALSGTGSGSKRVTDAAGSHSVTLSTASVGSKSGAISVTSSSQSVANNNFSQNVNYDVLDHSNGSFSSSSDQNTATVDFGYVHVGSNQRTTPFTVNNLVATASFTAPLDLTSVNNSGDTARLTTTAGAFTNLAAGSGNTFNAQLDSSVVGVYSATHTLNLSDRATIPGATTNTSLALTTTARVFDVATFPVTGFLFLPSIDSPLNTGPFSIQNGVTLTKTGPGVMNIDDVQTNDSGSQLVVSGGTVNVSTDSGPSGANLAVTVNTGAAANFSATQHLAALTVSGAAVATMNQHGSHVLATNALTTNGAAQVDLKDNDMIVHNGVEGTWSTSYSGVTGQIASGYATGDWDGPGVITSMSDANSTNHLTGLAIASGASLYGLSGGATMAWEGETIGENSVLVKYTYIGDADLNGVLDGDDYFHIDNGYANRLSNYINGDFNYDGSVDGEDYFLIDYSFANQGGSLLPQGLSAVPVPEPPPVVLLAVGAAFFLRRQRRVPVPVARPVGHFSARALHFICG